ncbi:MAG: hypothetical protein HYW89_00230 [Candidatus Sungiibacteriota bacterium]|uniref:Uncharacterized protein n=1 Tax=Candidatus Sungiibacteriota bacterium TaxID=2750080 RepID=A0A7T5UQQ5_9BACT|nr:MAG: hypothetical protein HYW89_00230 [Candidatus Sungbacteria bacterium]
MVNLISTPETAVTFTFKRSSKNPGRVGIEHTLPFFYPRPSRQRRAMLGHWRLADEG